MSLDLGTLEYVREQLSLVEPVTVRRMFGGAGFYARGYFFAILDDDSLYLKTDDSNRGDYLAVQSPPFAPFGEEGGSMDYYELPDTILDNPAKLKSWMEKSIAVAILAKERKGAKKRARGKPKTQKTKTGARVKSGKLKKTSKVTDAIGLQKKNAANPQKTVSRKGAKRKKAKRNTT